MINSTSQQGWLPKDKYEERNLTQGVSEHVSLTIMSLERVNDLEPGTIGKLSRKEMSSKNDRTIEEIVQGPGTLDEACRVKLSMIKKQQETKDSFLVQWFKDCRGRFYEETYLPDKNGELKLVKKVPMYRCI